MIINALKCIVYSMVLIGTLYLNNTYGQVKVGAYYFDGWTGHYPIHITKALTTSFADREPKWGWITSSPKIMDEQINLASDANLSFFDFCWYFDKTSYKNVALNNALGYYLASPNKQKLEFCLMVDNTGAFKIKADDWDNAVNQWLPLLKDKMYVKVNNKPLLTFFSVPALLTAFKTPEGVAAALEGLRKSAVNSGLVGVTIAACVYADMNSIILAQKCGFDVLTGYNYHSDGFKGALRPLSITSMQAAESVVWQQITSHSSLKYIPAVTLNWDPQPWANAKNNYATSPYYSGFSKSSVYTSVTQCIDWVKQNGPNTTTEKVMVLYAWNEYGEGAWLTPSKRMGNDLLVAVKDAINASH